MAYPIQVKDAVFARASGQCECIDEHLDYQRPPHPGGRCPHKYTQDLFYFVDKNSGAPGADTGTVDECVMVCSGCRGMFKPS